MCRQVAVPAAPALGRDDLCLCMLSWPKPDPQPWAAARPPGGSKPRGTTAPRHHSLALRRDRQFHRAKPALPPTPLRRCCAAPRVPWTTAHPIAKRVPAHSGLVRPGSHLCLQLPAFKYTRALFCPLVLPHVRHVYLLLLERPCFVNTLQTSPTALDATRAFQTRMSCS